MNKEIFLKTSDGIKIAINLYSKARDSVVIICPGWFMTKDSAIFKKISEDLFKNLDVITMDFRGSGRSRGFYTFSSKEPLDLYCVISYAKKVLVIQKYLSSRIFTRRGCFGYLQCKQP